MTKDSHTRWHITYLRCSTHAKRSQGGRERRTCHTNHTRQERVQEAIAAFLAGISSVEDVERLRGRQRDDGRERARLGEIAGELEEAAVRRRRLALAYAAGAMDVMVYQAADGEIVRQAEGWKGERGELEAMLASTMRHEERLLAVESVRPLLGAAFEEAQPRELSTRLQDAGIRVWCEEGQVVRVEMI